MKANAPYAQSIQLAEAGWRNSLTCPQTKEKVAEFLLEARLLSGRTRKHVAECAACASELAGMETTWKLLDQWRPPELTAFFDTRLYAKLRAEQSNTPAGLLERARTWLLYSCNLHMRWFTGVAVAAVLVIGGGTLALLGRQPSPAVQISDAVRDLQSYDRNADLIEQFNALDDVEDSVADASNHRQLRDR